MDIAARREAIARWRRMIDDLAAEVARLPAPRDPKRLRAVIVLHPDNASFDRAARTHWYKYGPLGRIWYRLRGQVPPVAAAPTADRTDLPDPLRRMDRQIDAIARDWRID